MEVFICTSNKRVWRSAVSPVTKSQVLSKTRKNPLGFSFALLIIKKTVSSSPVMKYLNSLFHDEKKKSGFSFTSCVKVVIVIIDFPQSESGRVSNNNYAATSKFRTYEDTI